MLGALQHVDGLPHEPHHLEGIVGVALERRVQGAAVGQVRVDVLDLVERQLGRHRLRRRHEERQVVRAVLHAHAGGAADVPRRQAFVQQALADGARVVVVEGVGDHYGLRPAAHRGHGHAAAPVPRRQHARRRGLDAVLDRLDEDRLGVSYFLVHSPIPSVLAPRRSASLRKSLSFVTTVTLPLAPAYRLMRR